MRAFCFEGSAAFLIDEPGGGGEKFADGVSQRFEAISFE